MKLLFIAEKYPPIVGGGETHLAQLAGGLAAMGHEVVVATDRTGVEQETDPVGVRIIHVAGLQRACKDLHCGEALRSLFALLTSESHDAVHVINYVPALMLGWLRGVVRAPIFMSSFETFVPAKRVFGMFEDFALEATLRHSVASTLDLAAMFCGSEAYRQWALAGGFAERVLRLIPHATDVDRFAFSVHSRQCVREHRGWSPDEFVFLVPARPVPRKRIEDVLTAAPALARRRRIRIVLTAPSDRGDVEYVESLRARIAREDIADVVSWEHDLAWNDMPALYSACDAVVLPSAHEGFAIALIEAMAASRPVIATDIEGPNEFVRHDATGFLYPSGDVELLTQAMLRVMNDDTTAMTERAASMTREMYSLTPMIRRHLAVYAEHCHVER